MRKISLQSRFTVARAMSIPIVFIWIKDIAMAKPLKLVMLVSPTKVIQCARGRRARDTEHDRQHHNILAVCIDKATSARILVAAHAQHNLPSLPCLKGAR